MTGTSGINDFSGVEVLGRFNLRAALPDLFESFWTEFTLGAGVGYRFDLSDLGALSGSHSIKDNEIYLFTLGAMALFDNANTQIGLELGYQINRPDAAGPSFPGELNLDTVNIRIHGITFF